jgi:intracellular multiplication protein IcmO
MRAPDESRQIHNRRIWRNAEKWWAPFVDLARDRETMLVILGALALAGVAFRTWFDLTRVAFFLAYLAFRMANRRLSLPLRVPMYANVKDFGDPKPGRKDWFTGAGIMYLGNDISGQELWIKDTDMKTHMLIYGTTGSGKTVSLEMLSYNAFVLGTGLIYIDPKGSPGLAHEIFAMARRVSREDDFLALDFMTGGKKPESVTPFRISNTTNPFAAAPADAIVNLISSLLPKDDGGSNSVFQQKAQGLLTALIPVLVALRDARVSLPLTDDLAATCSVRKGSIGTGMSIMTIREYLDPVMCVSLVHDPNAGGKGAAPGNAVQRGVDGTEPAKKEHQLVAELVDAPLLDVLKSSLSALNYTQIKDVKSQQPYLDQFGYAKGYFGHPLASISGTYGNLFNVAAGEVDLHDCLFNRRVLVSILPSLEKSSQECENLGKIILASVKNAVSGGLGDKLEGGTKEITGALPSASAVPGIIVVDEYAAIMMPGFEIILTQARSLGFMAIIASQDYSGMKGKDAKSCDQIVENTAVKLFMKIASAKETWDLAKSLFGEVNVEEVNPNDKDHSAIRSVAKITQNDMMNQIEGEYHAFYRGNLVRGATPYMVFKSEEEHKLRINRFIRTDLDPEKVRMALAAARVRERTVQKDVRAWMDGLETRTRFRNVYVVKGTWDPGSPRSQAA